MKQLNWYLIYGKPDIPDGKTVTPVNDVEIWQKCAGLTPVYSTLAGVLSDNSTLAILMSSDNAVDYMVRSTDWIDEQTLIPAMTSATTPSGEVSGTFPETGTYAAYKAFDGDSSTYAYYENSSDYDAAYLVYTFPTTINVKKAIITYGFHTEMTSVPHVNTNAIQAYVNNEWIDIASFPYATTYVSSPTTITVDIDDFDRNATSYRLKLPPKYTSNYNLYIPDDIKEVQFYTAGIVNNEDTMKYIGASDYAAVTLLKDSNWCIPLTDSTYRDYIINVRTAIMTGNNLPSGECIANSGAVFYSPSRELFRAFDGIIPTGGNYTAQFTSSYSGYMGYRFSRPVSIYRAIINNCSIASDRACKVDLIQGSNDGTTWTDLYDCEGNTDILINANLVPEIAYDRYIVNVRPTTQYANGLAEIQLFGRDPGGVQTWLHAAGITDKTYSTISEVLNDTTTLATLMSNNDAVDYLVTAKGLISAICADETAMELIGANDYTAFILIADDTWAEGLCSSAYFSNIFNIYVPTMTSATTPSGTVFGSTPYNSQRVPYRAFDGNDNTDFLSNTTGENWIGYQFTSPVCIKVFRMHPMSDPGNYISYCYQYTIEASNDGSTWTTLHTQTARLKECYALDNNNSYKYYRAHNLRNKQGASNTYGFNYVGTLQFYGRDPGGVQTWLRAAGITDKNYTTLTEVLNDSTTLTTLMASEDAVDYLVTAKAFINGITSNEDAMTAIGNSNYAANALLADSEWTIAIFNSTYMESIINAKVPTMTSDTTPSGVASASSIYDDPTHYPYNSFDGNISTTGWEATPNMVTNQWLKYEFPNEVMAKKFELKNYAGRLKNYRIEASNDNFVNETIVLYTGVYPNSETLITQYLDNNNSYKYYRIYCIDTYGGSYLGYMFLLQFYGRQDV